MSPGFLILTVLFIVVSAVMILIILVQRPQGGGLAGAFGGAGGGSTDTVFGGRVGDALTAMTVFAFAGYVLLAVGLNIMDPSANPAAAVTPIASTQPIDGAPQPATGLDEGVVPIDVDPAPLSDNATSDPMSSDGTIDPVIPPADDSDPTGQRPVPPADQPLDSLPPATAPDGGM